MQRSRYSETFDFERQRQQEEALRLKNARTGVNIFQGSWILTFVALIIVNLQLRGASPAWPPVGVEKLNPLLPTFATLGLLASAVLIRRGFRALKRDDVRVFLVQWRAALALGAAFVAVMAYEWVTRTPAPESVVRLANGELIVSVVTQYNAMFRVMTAFHGLHALIIGGYVWNVYRRVTAVESVDSQQRWSIEAGAKLWYFVVIAWMLFYVVLYWL